METKYTFGIEEEFFVVDAETCDSTPSLPAQYLGRCRDHLGGRVALELLQSQIEVQTQPHTCIADAAGELHELRAGLCEASREFGLGLIASGTHPFASWRRQRYTNRARSRMVMSDLGMLGYRNLLCGLHVHVAVPDPDRRVGLMTRAIPFLPLFLALSTSSPFWNGGSTGLLSYRLAAYDELPRTGLPPVLDDLASYEDFVSSLTSAGIIPDASYIWWAIRPSMSHPTLELRIADACTSVEDSIAIAALFRALVHRLDTDADFGRPADAVARAITEENRWRIQRDGLDARIVDVASRQAVTTRAAIEALVDALAQDAAEIGDISDLDGVRAILKMGTSAHRQIDVFQTARNSDASRLDALANVARWLMLETSRSSEAPASRMTASVH